MKKHNVIIEGSTIEEARSTAQDKAPKGYHLLWEDIVTLGAIKTIQAIADTLDDAWVKARLQVPKDATIIDEKMIHAPEITEKLVFGYSEEDAIRNAWAPQSYQIKAITLVTPGNRGFLGLGKKPHQYKIEVLTNATVEVTYNIKAKISVTFGDTPITEYLPSLFNDALDNNYDVQAQAYESLWEVVIHSSFKECFYRIMNDIIRKDPQARTDPFKSRLFYFASFYNAVIEVLNAHTSKKGTKCPVDIVQNLVALKMASWSLSFNGDQPLLTCEKPNHIISANDIQVLVNMKKQAGKNA